jgi:hypothetical protein
MIQNGDWPEVRREAERQGWAVITTKDGFVLLAPDGAARVAMHRLHRSSSPYALAQIVRRMRTAGFIWPPPRGGP